MTEKSFLEVARVSFHAALLNSILTINNKGIASNADINSRSSIKIANGIMERLGESEVSHRLAGQMAGRKFEEICAGYLRESFPQLSHLRPGDWKVEKGGKGGHTAIAQFEQYKHLAALEKASDGNPELAAALGSDYLIKSDIVVMRFPEHEDSINIDPKRRLVGDNQAKYTPIRLINNDLPILHASVSCKWTIRSDRAQNSRSEALNLMRNRKGRLPHIVAVTGEPMPSRIASIALGTGDIDCVYHFALPELIDIIEELEGEDTKKFNKALKLLETMINGKRLRDIADLPLDLII